MKKRLRKPSIKSGELQIYWGRPNRRDSPDICYAWCGDSSMRADTRLLHNYLGAELPDPFVMPIFSKMNPSLFKELEARGYDITTIKFSIHKRQPKESK